MSGLIQSIATKLSKADELPVVRVSRSFPVFGARSLMLYVPKGEDGGFQHIPMKMLEHARVQIEEREGKFHVKANTVTEGSLAILPNREQAQELVLRLSRAVAPSRVKWFWLAGIVLAVYILNMPIPQTTSKPAFTPNPYTKQTAPIGQLPQRVAPQGLAAAAPTAQPLASPGAVAPQTDVNDPFGLKVAPK